MDVLDFFKGRKRHMCGVVGWESNVGDRAEVAAGLKFFRKLETTGN